MVGCVIGFYLVIVDLCGYVVFLMYHLATVATLYTELFVAGFVIALLLLAQTSELYVTVRSNADFSGT